MSRPRAELLHEPSSLVKVGRKSHLLEGSQAQLLHEHVLPGRARFFTGVALAARIARAPWAGTPRVEKCIGLLALFPCKAKALTPGLILGSIFG